MAHRRTSRLRILLPLILAAAAYFYLSRSDGGDGKNTLHDSTVTTGERGSDSDPEGRIDESSANTGNGADGSGTGASNRIEGVFFSNAYVGNAAVGRDDPSNIDRRLTAMIGAARSTIDCALFELECERIADALIAAHRRGVAVRIAAESDYADNDDLKRVRTAGIPVVLDERSGLMHNKFIVIDSVRIWTGSFNATDNCAFRNNNNAVVIHSREVAENYAFEFEEMFVRREFGPRSTSNTPHSLVKLPDADVYTFFSPEDDVRSKVLRYLKSAKKRIRFMAFSMTDDEIGSLLIERAADGTDVEGVLESRGSGTPHSEYRRLVEAGIPVLTDGNPYFLHHKVIVIDGIWTITGSYNFTESASGSNDENLLVIKSRDVARMFEEEYERIKRMARVKA